MTTAPRTVIARDAARRSPHHAAAASWTSVALSVLAYGCESLGHAGPWTSLDRRAQRSTVDCEGATHASSYRSHQPATRNLANDAQPGHAGHRRHDDPDQHRCE